MKDCENKVLKPYRWYGFDLDGTIADNTNHAFGYGNIGKPIKKMTALMKRLNKQGYNVKIVTSRLGDVGLCKKAQGAMKEHIWRWCDVNLGFRPEITDRKDSAMECLYDDRARQVVRNKGVDMGELARELAQVIDAAVASPLNAYDKIVKAARKCHHLGLIK